MNLMVETLLSYRPEQYLLHEFAIMTDHFHILMTPVGSLERAVQCIKGGFSFKAKKAFEWQNDVWVAGFLDDRIRDTQDYEVHCRYIARNAVKARLVEEEAAYKYASPSGLSTMDAVPQGPKPGL